MLLALTGASGNLGRLAIDELLSRDVPAGRSSPSSATPPGPPTWPSAA
ncbi:hypothetical protein [Actinomyces ruminis]|nr:hypothetical protein [Actinomyces ruminis]